MMMSLVNILAMVGSNKCLSFGIKFGDIELALFSVSVHLTLSAQHALISTVAGKALAVEGVAAVLNAVDHFWFGGVAQIVGNEVSLHAAKVVTLCGALVEAESTPLLNAALLATVCKNWPHSTVKGPAAMGDALALGARCLHAVTAQIKSLLKTGNLAVVSGAADSTANWLVHCCVGALHQ